MRLTQNLAWIVILGLVMLAGYALAKDERVIINFTAKHCSFYRVDIEKALKALPGVKSVDFDTVRGGIIVTIELGKVRPVQLVTAINQMNAGEHHCSVELMPD